MQTQRFEISAFVSKPNRCASTTTLERGSLKILKLFVLCLTLLVGVVRAQTNLLIGSPEAVERHSLKSGTIFSLSVGQLLNGRAIGIGNDGWNTNFTARVDLENHFRSNFVRLAQLAVDMNVGQNRDEPFILHAQYYKRVNGPGVPYINIYYFVAYKVFYLVKVGNTYSLPPDLTDISMEFPSEFVVYEIPKYAWAQVDTVSSNGYLVRSVNSDSNPQEGFHLARSLIFIPTHHAVSSDSFKTTVRVVTGQNTFRVFDENGYLRPEKPAEVGVDLRVTAATGGVKSFTQPASLALSVKDGEPGRIYMIQSAPTLGGKWTDLPSGKVINLPAYENPVYASMDGVQQFYRAIPVDGVPIPK